MSGLNVYLVPLDGDGRELYGNWETDSGGRMRFAAPAGRFRVKYSGNAEEKDCPEVKVVVGKQTVFRLAVPMKGPTGDVWSNLPR